MRADLHTHSSVSDGTDAPADLVAKARDAGLTLIALCDHDTQAGVRAAQEAGQRAGVAVLAGIEVSCECDGITVHLLGLGCCGGTELDDELARVRADRDVRVDAMLERLAREGLVVTRADVEAAAADGVTLGRPHVADALVAAGFAPDRTTAFERWLAEDRPAYVPHYRLPLARGIALVRDAGGAAVVAHPWARRSRAVLTAEKLASLARPAPGEAALDGLEVDHEDHDPATRARLRVVAADLGLIVTGGSDYHGRGKIDHELGCHTTNVENWVRVAAAIAARGGRAPAV